MPPAGNDDLVAAARVAAQIRQWITAHQLSPGSRLPGERELARQVGSSRATVRRALDLLSDDGLVAHASSRIRRLTEQAPAAGRRVGLLGWRLSISAEAVTLFSATLEACSAALIRHGLTPVRLASQGKSWPEQLERQAVEAACLMPDVVTAGSLAAWLRRPKAPPLVAWGDGLPADWSPPPAVELVLHDHRAGAAALAAALLARGCRRLAVVLWEPPPTGALRWENERLAGYVDAVRAAGLAGPRVIRLIRRGGAFPPDSGEQELRSDLAFGFLHRHLHGPEAVDGLLLTDDLLVAPVATAARQAGRRPGDDLLLAGYDHIAAYGVDLVETPQFTVDQDAARLGEALAERLAARFRPGAARQALTLVPGRLVSRG